MEAEPGAVLLQVVGVNGRHPLTQSLGTKTTAGLESEMGVEPKIGENPQNGW